MGALRRAVIDGDTQYGSLMAGQSIGLVNNSMSVKEIINQLVNETEKEFLRIRTVVT